MEWLAMSIVEKQSSIREFFKKIVKENNLDGLVLTDFEGLPLVSYTDNELDEDVVSASCAAIISAGLIVAGDTNKPTLKQVIIDTEDGYLIFVPINNEYIVALFTPTDAKLGIVRVIMKDVERFISGNV